jgi:hypothetical protein
MATVLIGLRGAFVACALLAVSVSSNLRADEVPALPDREHFHLFLLAGQSNMAGRGNVEEEDRVEHPRVFTLDKNNAWVPAVDPIHFDKSVAGVGLGRTFGITVADAHPDICVGLIPCAVGGSPISSWEPGGYHDQTKSHPYDDARARVQVAMQRGTLHGILWHQGESDSNASRSGVYEEKLHALIARFRDAFGSPDVPFVAGQLGIFEERPWSDERRVVDAALRSLPEKVPHTAFVPSAGLSPNPDLIHFDAPSLREFGKRYAAAYQSLQDERASAAK